MHVRSKCDGGKVINRSQSGSWEFRCYGAGLQHNLGKEWGPKLWGELTAREPNPVFASVSESRNKKMNKEKERKKSPEVKAKRRQSKYSEVDNTLAARQAYAQHGDSISTEEVTADISPEYLTELKSSFYDTNVKVSKERANENVMTTRGQSDNDQWMKERSVRITASVVGGIAKMRKTTKHSKKEEIILYHKFRGNEATRYGNRMERFAREKYLLYYKNNGNSGLEVRSAGLVVCTDNPWLAASPDDCVHDPKTTPSDGLVEYKNPYSARKLTREEACDTISSFCLQKVQSGTSVVYKLKNHHDYHFQVQCQMCCSDTEWCDFVVNTEESLHVKRLFRDRKWWEEQLDKLKYFYFESLLPELACPHHRNGGIREPKHSA